ncbi:beta-galactosidase trimerization domain-containing protein [Paenibacillus sp. CC-CFT747]|nr:beta-galactosidase trimerization domain-containing protein [Paenibacillus sp. CC-CFT747]
MGPALRWEVLAATRSCSKTGRFWISELQSHHQALFNPGSLVHPHELRWWNWEAIMNGAKGILYWKWHPFPKGLQTFGRGLVDSRCDLTPRAEEARRIADVLKSKAAAFEACMPVRPKAAILYDKLNHDFTKAFTMNYQSYLSTSIYTDSIAGLYQALWDNQVEADFVTPSDVGDDRLGSYRVLFVTNQLNVDDSLAAALIRYAENGGTIVWDGKCGEIDDNGLLHAALPGGPLNDVLGLRLHDVDIEGLQLHATSHGQAAAGFRIAGHYERKLLSLEKPDVEVLFAYEDGWPGITHTPVGQGILIMIGTFLWLGYQQHQDEGVKAFAGGLADRFGLRGCRADSDLLKVCAIQSESTWIVCAFNYSEQPIESWVELPLEWESENEEIALPMPLPI